MKRRNINRLVLALAIINSIGGLVLVVFLYMFITNPNSDFNRQIAENIQKAAAGFSPLAGIKGDKGDPGIDGKDGKDGTDGSNGSNGQNGANGQNATSDQIAAAVAQYLILNPPQKGDTGPAGNNGVDGQPGPVAEFQCSPEKLVLQYRYPGNEEWTDTNARCTVAESSSTQGGSNGN